MSLILVDGSALVYRAYYAFINNRFTAPSGEPTSVAFGFLMGLLRLIESRRPSHLAVVFDRPEPTFRHRRYAEYKATRKPMPADLAAQLPRLRELLEAWGVAVCELAGWEGDDVMATLARRSAGVVETAWFYTGDKDFLQLVDARTGLLKPGRRGDEVEVVTLAEVRRDFRLEPAALIDVFALSGDASDNIPGAPGIGEKTALQLIQRYGSLDALYNRLDDEGLAPRLQRILAENREQVYLSRDLFRIDVEAPLPVEWPRLRTCLPAGGRFPELLQELGLRRVRELAQRLAAAGVAEAAAPALPEPRGEAAPAAEAVAGAPAGGPPESAAPVDGWELLRRRDYRIINDSNALDLFLASLPEGAPLAVDTETDSLRPERARLVGVSLSARPGEAAYIPVLIGATQDGAAGTAGAAVTPAAPATLFDTAPAPATPVESRLEWVRPRLGAALADPSRLKVGQNLKFDAWVLARHGLPLAGPLFDTLVAAYVLDPGRSRFGLDELAAEHLGLRTQPYAALFAAGDRRRDILAVPLERLGLYAAEDADVARRLHDVFAAALADAGLEELFREVEMPLAGVLLRMERHGIRVDTAFLGTLRSRFAAELAELEARIHAAAGEPFNVQSPQQLARILFEKLGLKPTKKIQTGWSTDVSVLSDLAERHPLPGLILEHRQLAKLQNTYVDTLPELVDPATGLLHTSFNQAVAATGRLSSSDPNLQNIPVRTELGRLIRQAFVPRAPDRVFLSADYSQIELRLLAHLSEDVALRAAFRDGADVHRRTAALIAGVPESQVTAEMRTRAKAINFGVIYGMGARALARQTGVSTREATQFIASYFATYPGVRDWIEATRERARREGRVATLLGRRRLLPDIGSPNNRLRSLQERIAVNTPIQGTAADLIKLAMIRLDAELGARGLRSLLLLQVHDELLLEVPRDELAAVRELVRDCMENVWSLTVPLVVEMHDGENWAQAHG